MKRGRGGGGAFIKSSLMFYIKIQHSRRTEEKKLMKKIFNTQWMGLFSEAVFSDLASICVLHEIERGLTSRGGGG